MHTTPGPHVSRRDLLKFLAALPMAASFGGPSKLLAAIDGRTIEGYDPALVPTTSTLQGWLQQLHDFGPIRMTGTKECRAFEEWLAARFAGLGLTVERDQFRLTSWECRVSDCSIAVAEDSGATRTLDVVSYYPFAATTKGKLSIVGRVLVVPGVGVEAARAFVANTEGARLAGAIVVMDMPLRRQSAATPAGAPASAPVGPIARFPDPAPPRPGAPSPAGQGGRDIMEVFENRCRGLVLCYTDVTNDTARHNYLPFSDQHRSIPALWVGADSSRYLRSVSGKATISLRCDATATPDARADTLVATLPGQSDEVIFLTTQTDGPNEANENGALGVLALATYASKVPAARRRRTLVCSLPTGHYAAGAIADPKTGSGRRAGTRGVLEKWPEMARRIVGQMAFEQMGAMEWAEVNGTFSATGQVAPERWIPTPSVAPLIGRLYLAAANGEDPRYSNAAVVEGGAPGEGGSVRSRDLPGVGLMGQPQYFFRADPNGVLEKLSPNVMRNQIAIGTKLMVLMDRLTPGQLRGAEPVTDRDLSGT